MKNAILKGKGLDRGSESPLIKICWVPPPNACFYPKILPLANCVCNKLLDSVVNGQKYDWSIFFNKSDVLLLMVLKTFCKIIDYFTQEARVDYGEMS